MTRFEAELKGVHGEFWQKQAIEDIQKIEKEFEEKEILVLDCGALVWKSNGRALPKEVTEKLEFTNIIYNKEAHEKFRDEQTTKILQAIKPRKVSRQEMHEMKAAFGKGTTVVNVFTGKKIKL
jgi:hypothetical protein